MPNCLRPALPALPSTLALVLLLAACGQSVAPVAPVADPAAKPAQAVVLLTGHLRDNDLAAFTRDAVPPALHAQLDSAWRQGRSRWPLDELPFGSRLPAMLKSLSAPGAEARLQKTFSNQFARAERQIHGAATSLGLFGAQYLQQQGDYSDGERQHYTQLVTAASQWGATAPLGDPARARLAISSLTRAARATGLKSEADFAKAGMAASLRKLGPLSAAFKQTLAGYGWNLDADLAGMDVTLQQQTGDTAQVRMRYQLAGHPVDTVVAMQRIDGRWYVADFLRHARVAAAAPAVAKPAAAQAR